jgi:drug/metabolite transporter (DMT)-like permease
LTLLAGAFFGLDIAFWHASLVMTSVANATFLVNLGNAAVGLVAWVVLRERPAKIWLVALAVALVGAFMLSRGAANTSDAALTGDLLALLAAVMVGLYLFFAKLARRESGAMPVLFWSTATTLLVSAVACGVQGEAIIPPDPTWFVWPLALAVVAHVVGQGLIVAGVGRTPAALAGLLLLGPAL